MSLIEEALRKVQDPTLRAFPGTAQQQERPARAKPSAQAQAQVAPAPVAAHSWSPAPAQPSSAAPNNSALIAVAIGVLGLTAALIIGGAFWMGRTLHGPSVASRDVSPGPSADAPAGPAPAAARNTAPPAGRSPGYVLSGVIEGLGDPYAVVNGLVVRAGDGLEGATIVAIGSGSVTLRRDDGSQLVLRVSP